MSKEEYARFVTLAHKITEWLIQTGRAIRAKEDTLDDAREDAISASAEVVTAINAMEDEE